MVWYNLKLIFRKIKNSKTFPLINITGLSVGLICSILAFLYIQDELSYDKCFKNTENIYRLTGNHFGGTDYGSNNPVRFMDNILASIPEVKSGVRVHQYETNIKIGKNNYKEKNFILTDTNFFSFFNWELLSGDPNEVLANPNQLVISESTAKAWFGEQNPVGEKVNLDNYLDATISGVFKDFPEQSHIRTNLIISLSTVENYWRSMFTSWGWFSSDFYLKVDGNSNISNLNVKIRDLWNDVSQDGGERGSHIKMLLQPFSDIHLRSGYIEDGANNILIVYGIGALAVFILIIACFNFINLSIALYSKRTIETGIKKTLGANRKVFSRQVFLEISLYLITALIISSLVISNVIHPINNFLGKNLEFSPFNNPALFICILLTGLIIIVGTGFFPLINLLRVETVGILKGGNIPVKKKIGSFTFQGNLRNILVIVQFTFGIMLILSAIIVNKQLKLIRQKDSGFDKEQVMIILNPVQNQDFYNKFKQSIQQYPEISVVTSANNVPTDGIWNWGTPKVVGEEWKEARNCGYISVNYEYFDAIGAEFIEGRNFIKDKTTEDEKLIITETLKKKLGLNNPIGKVLTDLWDNVDREIVGVIKDVEYQTIHNKRSPILFFCRNRNLWWYQKIIIKLQSPDLSKSIATIEKEWKKAAPDWPIDYFFLDEKFEANYQKEKQIAVIVNVLTWIAIFLCCLGLFGLALYNINSRIKEVGVRKVNGAKESEIMVLINKEFFTWILTAFIIAVPLSIVFINKWLNNFAYRTKIPWWVLLLAGALAFAIASLTVSWQSWKAARRNPVEALRYE